MSRAKACLLLPRVSQCQTRLLVFLFLYFYEEFRFLYASHRPLGAARVMSGPCTVTAPSEWRIHSLTYSFLAFRGDNFFYLSFIPLLCSLEFPSLDPGGLGGRQLFPLYKVLRHKGGLLDVL